MTDDPGDVDFVAFGNDICWVAQIDRAHPEFLNGVWEVTRSGQRSIAHFDDFRDAAVAAAELARSAAAAATPAPVPKQAGNVEWLCRWALETGGIGGLTKTGHREFAHIEADAATAKPVILECWDDFVDAVLVIFSGE